MAHLQRAGRRAARFPVASVVIGAGEAEAWSQAVNDRSACAFD
jgi:hypothetical protein